MCKVRQLIVVQINLAARTHTHIFLVSRQRPVVEVNLRKNVGHRPVIWYEISRYQQPCNFDFRSLGFDAVFLGESSRVFREL